MNKVFGVILSAVMLSGSAGAALASTTNQPCETQVRAQVQTLQQQVAALEASGNSNVQSSEPVSDFQVQTGG